MPEGVVKKPNQPSAISDIKKRTAQFPDSCTGKRFKMSKPPGKPPSTPLTRFLYKCDKPKIQPSPRPCTSASFSAGPPSSGDPPSPNASPSSSRATSTTVVHSPAWALKTSTPGGQTSLSITSSSATVHPAPSSILTQPYNASKTPALPPPVKQFHNKEIDFGIEELFSDIFDEEMTQEDGMSCYNGQKFNEPNDQGRSMIHRKIYSSKPRENSLYTNTLGVHTNQKSAYDKENDTSSWQSCTNREHTNASTLKQGLQTPSKGKENVCGGIGTPMKSQFTFSRRGKPADDSGYGSGIEQDERLTRDDHRLSQNYKEDSADYFITGETKKFGKDEIQRQEKGNWMGTVEGCKAKEDNIGCEYPTASSYVNEYENNVTADVHEGMNIDEEQVEMQDEGFHLEQNLEAQNSCQLIPSHGFSQNVTNKSSQPYEQQCTQSLQSSQYAPETQLFQSHNQTTLGYPHQNVHDIPARSLTREQRFSCPSKAQMGPRFSNPTQLRQRLPRFQRPNCAPRLHPTFSQQLSSQQTHSDPILPGRFQHPFQTKENQVQFPCMQDLYCQNDTLQQEHHISSSRPQSQNSPLNQQSNCLGKQGPHYLQQPQWLRSRETFPKHQNYQVGQQSFPEERQPNPLSIRHPFSTQSEHNQLRPPVIGQRQHRPFFSQSQQQADFSQRPRRPLFNQRQRHPISSHLQPHINRIQQPMLSEQGRPRSSDFKRQPMFGQRHPEIPFTRRMQRPVFTSPQPLFRNRQNQLQSLQEIKKNCFHSLNAVDQVLQQTSDSEAHTNIQKFQSRVQTLGQRGQIETQNDPSGQECHFQPTIQQFPKESRIDLDSLLSEVQPEPFPSLNALVTDSDPFASTQQQVNTKEDTRHDTDFNRSFSEPVQHQQRKSQPRYPFGISKATLEEEWGNQIENEKAFDESFTDAPPSVNTGGVNCNVSGNTNVGNIVTNQEPPNQNFSFPIFPSTEQRTNLDQIISATQDFNINQVKLNTGSVQSAERNTLHPFTPKLPSLAQLTTKQSSAIQPVTPQQYPLAQASQTVSEYENSYKKWRERFSPLTIPKGNGQFNESKSNSDFSSRSTSYQSQDSDRESEWADLDLFQMCRQIEHGKLQSLYQPFKTRSPANAESIDQRKDKPTLLIHPSIKSPTSLSKSPVNEPNSHSPVVPNVNEGTKSLPVGTVTPRECNPSASIDPKCHQEDSVRVEVLSGRNTLRDIHITLSRGQQCTPDIGKGSTRNTNIVEGPNSV
ncbi:uncharacterized protein LOC143035580 [Oratosquilla oratoria]|uniref:uncharacterized protein LOC143035580 n=1 Tax=Oratosquilla oratoria TaxID=337810 RepID=UPI003F75DF85